MSAPAGYTRLPTGQFTKDSDGSGPYAFDGSTMSLVATGTGGGGGGGAVTVADGADVTQGALADAVVAAGASGSISAKLRRLTTDLSALLAKLPAALGITTSAGSLSVAPASDATFLIAGAIATRTDKSGTITTGGAAQTAIASNASRKGFEIQNQSSANLYFSTLATAVQGQPSVLIAPGQLYETPIGGSGTGAVSLIGPTTGQAYAAREWV
jgi:hypothetical protein